MPTPLNFDAQSGALLPAEVLEAMRPYLENPANPASLHRHGVRARAAIATAREQIARAINARPEEILFTASQAETLRLAFEGQSHITASTIEQRLILAAAQSTLPVDSNGQVLLENLDPKTTLATIQWANSEIGTLQPIAEIAAECHKRNIPLFTDATAAFGWTPIDVSQVPVTMMAWSAPAFGAPPGIHVLYRRGQKEPDPTTEPQNTAALVGTGVAIEKASQNIPERIARIAKVQAHLWTHLQEKIDPITLNGPALGAHRLVSNLNVSVPDIEGEAQVLLADLQSLLLTSGPACLNKTLRLSHVFEALTLPPDRSLTNVLFTLRPDTTEEEASRAVEIYARVVQKLRAMLPTLQP